MTDNANAAQQDLFDDTPTGEATQADTGATNTSQQDEGNDNTDANAGGEGTGATTGAQNTSGTPPEGQPGDPEFVVDAKGQKLIPEHRFKAALKKATDDHELTKAELAKYTAPQIPDKDTDPEGHDLHIRMEASKSVMMEMRPDYQEKIDHFAVMMKDNPLLEQAVAKHPLPAKLAYDIAAKDLEIKEALGFKQSDEYKEFTEWKKNKGANPPADQQTTLQNTVANGLRSVPNLNRSTNASPNRNVRKTSADTASDDLFKDAPLDR